MRRQVWSKIPPVSNFPDDIFGEMFALEFNQFNNESGSFQRIIPNQAHFFLFEQKVSTLFVIQEAEVKEIKTFLGVQSEFCSSFINSIFGLHWWNRHSICLLSRPGTVWQVYPVQFYIENLFGIFKIFGLFDGTCLTREVG